MNDASYASLAVSGSRRHPRARRGVRLVDVATAMLSGLLSVAVLAVGLRLTLDAGALASRFKGDGYAVGATAVRCLGIALTAWGQSIAVAGVVWRLYRRRRLDRWLALLGLAAGLLAAFASAVLVAAGPT